MGSSELTGSDLNQSKTYNFIPHYTNFNVFAIGHGGNQSFSIFSQLLSAYKYLENSKVVIILSPSWFTNEYSKGTSIASFLEFNSERFLYNIINAPNLLSKHKNYISNYIYNNFKNISYPNIALKTLYYYNLSTKNILFRILYSPVIYINKLSYFYFNEQMDNNNLQLLIEHDSINVAEGYLLDIPWDSLYSEAINYQKSISTNNDWGINNEYYNAVTKSRKEGKMIDDIHIDKNNEFDDLLILIDLLRNYNTNALFILSSLNPYAYNDLCKMQPIIDRISEEIKNNNFPILNQFVCEKNEFQIGNLTDEMHLGDYGWYKINNFIIENYFINE